jgi:putative membrane protein
VRHAPSISYTVAVPEETRVPNDRRAAEYLANERTFLAWIRTSIAVISLGFVLARFSLWLQELAAGATRTPLRTHGVARPMGEALMIFGGLLAALAGWRYHTVNRAIEEDRVRPNRGLIILIAVSVVLLALVMAGSLYVLPS